MKEIDLFNDFDQYSRALIASNDVDPVYPFIKDTLRHFGFEPDWFCIAYTTFYHLGSAMRFCKAFPESADYNRERFFDLRNDKTISKMGHERRGSQRNMFNQHAIFDGYIKARDNWNLNHSTNHTFRKTLSENVPFHGPWASFKVAEVFEKVLDLKQLAIPDLGLEGKDLNSNDGPVGGLRWLYGRDNHYTAEILPHWNRFGENLAKGWKVDMGAVETCLCKFHKMVSGNYYIGHDIDELNECRSDWGEIIFDEIMGDNFGERFWKGVEGVRKELKPIYKNRGEIVNDDFAAFYPELDILETILNTP